MDASTRGPHGRRLLQGVSQAALLGVAVLFGADASAATVSADAKPVSAGPKVASPAPAKGKSASPAEAGAADPLAMDSLLDQPHSDIDLTTVDPADWAPDHPMKTSSTQPTPTVAGPDGAGKAADKQQAGKSDTDVDPEPDKVVVPPAPPSSDPLDRPRPTAGATQPDPAKTPAAETPPAAKTPAAKAEPSKADPAKPAAAEAPKTGAPTTDAKANPPAPGAVAPAVAPTPAVEPLPPLNAALKAALDKKAAAPIKGQGATEKRKERDAVAFFYASHGFAPAWSDKGKAIAAVEPVLARLGKAGDDALNIPSPPTNLKTDGSPEEVAAADLALTEAVVAYARQATGARIEPRSISPLIGAKPTLADPAEVLDGLIAAGAGAGDKLAALNPGEPRYVALREKLAEIRGAREPAAKSDQTIPDGPILRVGMRDERVPLLRTRFNVEATSDAADADLVYDKAVAAAVSAFQREHGLVASGLLGARTTAALNGGTVAPQTSSKLEGTIVANMEMWRWMPRDMGRERIEVNVPDYLVTVFHDNEAVAKNRVVVGKTETPTPIFSNTMKYLIVNPVWNVPQSIIKNEFGGEARGFKARYVRGQLFLQQPAGPKNALGRIKFMFPNDFSVYLHDTPAKHLFSVAKRAYSHGCVRVDKPFEFAESVLNDAVPEGGKIVWNQTRLQKMLGTTERYVNLPTPLPIHIEYFTASVDGDSGRVNVRDDIYGYTGAVAAALGYGKAPAVIAGDKSLVQAAEVKVRKRRIARRQSYDDAYDPRPQVEAAPAQSARSFFFPW